MEAELKVTLSGVEGSVVEVDISFWSGSLSQAFCAFVTDGFISSPVDGHRSFLFI